MIIIIIDLFGVSIKQYLKIIDIIFQLNLFF